jgi:ectoine hydroxylase-related dioxygenase (phytanoyl-CoA dioxygenase family)
LITEEQLEFWQTNGYLAIPDLIGADRVSNLRKSADRLVEIGSNLGASNERFKLSTFGSTGSPGVVQQICDPHELGGEWMELASDPAILDVIEGLLGPNVALYYTMFMMKPALQGLSAPWHQDLAFFVHDQARLVACQVYIDDSTPENGCLKVVPGSHRTGLANHFDGDRFVNRVVGDTSGFEASAVALPMKAGGAVFWHALTLHASDPNQSASPRRGMTMEYKDPTTSLMSGSFYPGLEVRGHGLMVRGSDPTGVLLPAIR